MSVALASIPVHMPIKFKNIVQSMTVPTFIIDTEHRVVAWNTACERMTGIKAEDIIGTREAWRGFYPTPRPCLADLVLDQAYQELDQLYPSHGNSKFSQGMHAENWFADINGKKRYLIFDAEPIYDDHGQLIGVLENLEDITEIKTVEERLMLSDKVFTYTNQAILITDAKNRIIATNQAFTRLTGYELEEVSGKTPAILSSGRHGPEFYAQLWHNLLTQRHWEGEIWDRRKDGTIYPKWLTINAVVDKNDHPTHFIAIFTDISERKQAEARIQHIAFHDALTGLPNRMLFHDRLQQAIHEAHREKTQIGLMFIDLDRFKLVNDTLGHHIGDLLLQEVASRLRECVRETDTVARLGGDEFVVILPSIHHASDAGMVASKVLRAISQEIEVDGHSLFTPPSIGISIYPIDGETAEALMQSADTAMYHVKESGKNNFQFFTSSMNEVAQQRATIEQDLRIALKDRQFELYYQPKLKMNPLRIVGCEALIRWKHPKHGYIPPDKFIPIAEETGLMLPIGEWVMSEAAKQLAQWTNAGYRPMLMAINLSAAQFRDRNLLEKLQELVTIAKLEPKYLEIEITESILMDSVATSADSLIKLKAQGIRLAIDDFGTGYSSLAYLKTFAVDTLKIDKSFVRDMTTDSSDAAIVSAIISLSHKLGLQVVAEGVETAEQLAFLCSADCDIFQGYYFSRPLPAAQFLEFVQTVETRAPA